MPKPHEFTRLEKQFARLLGQRIVASQPEEGLFGLKAITEAGERALQEVREIDAKLDATERQIWHLYDALWDRRNVQPIMPAKRDRKYSIAHHTYTAIKKAGEPLTARQVAHRVADALGMESPTDQDLKRLEVGVSRIFRDREKERLMTRIEGKPLRWEYVRRPLVAPVFSSANSLPKPWHVAGSQLGASVRRTGARCPPAADHRATKARQRISVRARRSV